MKLRDWMAGREVTAKEMAERLGVSRVMITRITRHGQVPRPDVMSRIVAATGGEVGPEDFYEIAPPARRRAAS